MKPKLPPKKTPPKKKSSTFPKTLAGRFEIQKKLGQGALGQVLLAKDLKNFDQVVALKRLSLKGSSDPGFLTALRNEFATLRLLSHPNLAQVYDLGESPQEFYLSREYIEGTDIFTACVSANLNTIFQFMVQCLRALNYLHRRGILHLDLKPENILVPRGDLYESQNIKLIDFGLAQRLEGIQGNEDFSGTPPYAAPEILKQQPPSPASDLYSLGILFHKILTQEFPFSSQEPWEIMNEQLYRHTTLIKNLPPALPDKFRDLISKMISQDPQKRFQNSGELLQEMNQILQENFSLRSPTAPVQILEETDFQFRRSLRVDILRLLKGSAPQTLWVHGEEGSGKSYLLRRIKEILQMEGVQALHFQGQSAINFLKEPSSNSTAPLLLDFNKEINSELKNLLAKFLKSERALLVASPGPPPGFQGPLFHLSPLQSEEVGSFLEKEIKRFPKKVPLETILELTGGNPIRIEELLQSLREEGFMQWEDHGWTWVGPDEVPWNELISRRTERWQARLNRLRDILKISPLELEASTLEGLLNMEKGALREPLKKWVEAGQLQLRSKASKTYYYVRPEPKTPPSPTLSLPWPQLQKRLQRLYESNYYDQGVQWVRLIQKAKQDPKEIPEAMALWGSRHLVAAAYPQEALDFLPPSPPNDLKQLGLYHEIRARAYFSLGVPDKTTSATHEAMIAYQKAQDHGGVARVLNLRGFILKTQSQFIQAEDLFKKALAEAQLSEDNFLRGTLEMNLATWYHDRGRYEVARGHYQRALKLISDDKHTLFACILYHNWVNFLFHSGNLPEAETACFTWLHLALKNHQTEQTAAAYNYLSLLAEAKGHGKAQENYLDKAIGLLKSLPFLKTPHLLPQFLLNRAYLHMDAGRTLPAQLDAEAAWEGAHRLSNSFIKASAELLLGRVFRDRKKPDLLKAHKRFAEAYQVVFQNQYRQLLWEVEFERGLLEKKKGSLDKAKEYFEKAEKALQLILEPMPEPLRRHYLRDRKLEKIHREIRLSLGRNPHEKSSNS